MASYLFHGRRFLDPRKDDLLEGVEVLVEGDRVKEVSDRPIKSSQAVRVNTGNWRFRLIRLSMAKK